MDRKPLLNLPRMHESAIYRISIKGRSDPKWVNRLEEMNLTEATRTSDVFRGRVTL